jgi:hypothetical protein
MAPEQDVERERCMSLQKPIPVFILIVVFVAFGGDNLAARSVGGFTASPNEPLPKPDVVFLGCPSGMVERMDAGHCEISDNERSQIAPAFIHRANNDKTHPLLGKALSGNVDAQFDLARAYAQGAGITANSAEAYYWYRQAALRGDPEAKFTVSIMLHRGLGVDKNREESVRWLIESAHSHHFVAQRIYAGMLAKGSLVPRDKKAAAYWRRRAEATHKKFMDLLSVMKLSDPSSQ